MEAVPLLRFHQIAQHRFNLHESCFAVLGCQEKRFVQDLSFLLVGLVRRLRTRARLPPPDNLPLLSLAIARLVESRSSASVGRKRDSGMANVAFATRVHIAQRKSDVGRIDGPVRLGKDDDRLDTSGLFNLTVSRVAFGCPGETYDELTPIKAYLPDFSPQVTDALWAPNLQEHAGKFPARNEVCPGYRSEHMSSCYTPPHNFRIRNSEAR